MNAQQIELYHRIQEFSLDRSDTDLPFSKRLARDNAWTDKEAQRAIAEYKKFAFLAVVAGHPVTPSDRVDRVWHLHLIYTHSYWNEFCPQILGTPLHHGPTRGGKSEQHKFTDWYNKTLASYRDFFALEPPEDVWPPARIRFSQDLYFQNVNPRQNWIVPKPNIQQIYLNFTQLFRHKISIALLVFVALIITGCEPSSAVSAVIVLGCIALIFIIFLLIASSRDSYIRGGGSYRDRSSYRSGGSNCRSVGISYRSGGNSYRSGGSNYHSGGDDSGCSGGGGCGGSGDAGCGGCSGED